jgi:hypothetical protein
MNDVMAAWSMGYSMETSVKRFGHPPASALSALAGGRSLDERQHAGERALVKGAQRRESSDS